MEGFANFYVATASVTGALIGLLFVAISVSRERLTGPEADPIHRVRASAALTTLTNALVIALFALIPGLQLGVTVVAVGLGGVLFVVASMLLLRRERGISLASMAAVAFLGMVLRRRRGAGARDARDAAFLFALLSTLCVQVLAGVLLTLDPQSGSAGQLLATIIIVCCFIGVERSWELIGGPSIGITREVRALWGDDPRTGDSGHEGGRRPSEQDGAHVDGTTPDPHEGARRPAGSSDR